MSYVGFRYFLVGFAQEMPFLELYEGDHVLIYGSGSKACSHMHCFPTETAYNSFANSEFIRCQYQLLQYK